MESNTLQVNVNDTIIAKESYYEHTDRTGRLRPLWEAGAVGTIIGISEDSGTIAVQVGKVKCFVGATEFPYKFTLGLGS